MRLILVLEQSVQGGFSISVLRGFQNSAGQGPEHPKAAPALSRLA